jgi:hypothetical protein
MLLLLLLLLALHPSKVPMGSSSMLAAVQAVHLLQLLPEQQQQLQQQTITTTAVRLAVAVALTVVHIVTTTARMAGAVRQLQPAEAVQLSTGSTTATVHLQYRQVSMHMYHSRRQVMRQVTT